MNNSKLDANEEEKEVIDGILQNESVKAVKSDDDLGSSDARSLSEHNNLYTRLLKAYVDSFEETCQVKSKQKSWIAIASIVMLLIITACMVIITIWAMVIVSKNSKKLFAVIPELITALASLVGAYITLPKLIVNYLFNKDEEKNMAAVIGKIQDYDSNIRNKR